MEYCTIIDNVTKGYMLPCGYSMLVNIDRVNENQFYQYLTLKDEERNADGSDMYGTVYYVAKDYYIKNGLRVFNRIPCLYSLKDFNASGTLTINHDFMTNADVPSITLKDIV